MRWLQVKAPLMIRSRLRQVNPLTPPGPERARALLSTYAAGCPLAHSLASGKLTHVGVWPLSARLTAVRLNRPTRQ
jgi:hypothetical protein